MNMRRLRLSSNAQCVLRNMCRRGSCHAAKPYAKIASTICATRAPAS